MSELSATELEVMKHAFTAIPEQMGASLQRSAYSPNIKERKDESCAIFNSDLKMLAQAEHIPVHLGAMPSSLKVAVNECDIGPKDQIILNNPYAGGTHLPDITLIKPIQYEGELIGYAVNRAHHADVGGKVPGSMPGNSKTLEDEGIIISPRYIVKNGEYQKEIFDLLKKARSPKERIGDIKSQIGANDMGSKEFIKAVDRFGLKKFNDFSEQILRYSEKRTRKIIRELSNGEYSDYDFMEWEPDVKLNVEITVSDENIHFDFAETGEQVKGNINAPRPVTLSAVYYVLRCLLPEDIPINEGCYRPVTVDIPRGTILNPNPPAAVSAGNVETSQRVVELLLKTLRKLLPDIIPAESQGTMNNLIVGSDEFTYYETIGGGAGASSKSDGESGVHVHMTNTKNTPIEALENDYPLLVRSYKLRRASGGNGIHKGGDGIVREIEALKDATLSIQSERRKYPPKGANGGENGKTGENIFITDGNEVKLSSKVTREIKEGDVIRVKTPGGGGWGKSKD